MEIKDWKYYHHAAIPTVAPHKIPDLEPIKNGSIWKLDNRNVLFARYTTEFDCGYETEWFYLCRKKPFSMDELSKSARKSIRKALTNCYVQRINPEDYLDDMWRVYREAIEKYKHKDFVERTEEQFKSGIINRSANQEYWAAFLVENDLMIGYDGVGVYDDYVEDAVGKYSAKYMKFGASDAITFSLCEYYLSLDNIEYVCCGERSINHETNVQSYLEQRFRFEKVYCHLNIVYNPKLRIIIPFLFHLRKPLCMLDSVSFIHQINSVLKMEEIVRHCARGKKLE